MQQYLKFNSPIHNLQVFLRTISRRYPNIPLIIPDGIYGTATENAVKAFQKEMNMNSTGVADNSTWDMIVNVYRQIESETSNANKVSIYPEAGLSEEYSSYHPTVIIMQAMMYAISERFENIPAPTVNGEFDAPTINTVKAIQIACGLNPDGNPTRVFWNFLSGIYETFISVNRVENSGLHVYSDINAPSVL